MNTEARQVARPVTHPCEGRAFILHPRRAGMFRPSSLILLLLAGCATHATTRPAANSEIALRPLERIAAPATLPSALPTSRPTAPAPLESLQLFAQARAAMDSNKAFAAIQLLDQAINLDPDSYELQMAMGKSAMGTTLRDRALPAYQKALQLRPAETEPWIQISRVYLQQDQTDMAIRHLRRAMLTPGYERGGESAIWTDFLLARALQQAGYDLASARAYEAVLIRMPNLSGMYRGPAELMQVLQNPDLLFFELSQIYGRLRQYPTALAAVEEAIEIVPGNAQYSLARARLLMLAGRGEQARQFMPEVVSRFGSDLEVMTLLREVYANSGGDPAAIAALRNRLLTSPGDMELGFTLADLLTATGDSKAAGQVLDSLVTRSGYGTPAVKRLFAFHDFHGQTRDAALLVIEATARHPDHLSEISPLMIRLTRFSRHDYLRLRDLQQMQVPNWAESARLFWVGRLAQVWGRDQLARSVLEKAVRQDTPFPPAYRALLNHYWSRRDWDEKRKMLSSHELATLAQMQGQLALAAELRGMIALNRKLPLEAARELQEAVRLGETDPDVQLGLATVQLLQGKATDAEQTLLRITEQFPQFEQSYAGLIDFYVKRRLLPSAMRTLQKWLANDPHNPSARLQQAMVLQAEGRAPLAERVLLDLFDDYADNAQVLGQLWQVYSNSDRVQQYIDLLERKRHGRPDIREVAEVLVDVYSQLQRSPEAMRVVQDMQRSAGNDPDLLYYVSNLYVRLEDQKDAQTVLEQVVKIDPGHSSACNDLGYYMADEGIDLPRAESLIRIAVREEPDNQAFLDSLGWVLYKQGRLEEAHKYLEQAIAQTVNPDAVVLDHLGDVLYRMGDKEHGRQRWTESQTQLEQFGELRGERQRVLLQLKNKLRQLEKNQPVQTAPMIQGPATEPVSR